MKKYSFLVLFVLVTAFSAAALFAQGFNGTQPNGTAVNAIGPRWQAQSTTVARLNTLPNKSWVTLTGNIVNSAGRKSYTFRDSTGEIIVSIERSAWGTLTLGPNDRVEIVVEISLKRNGTIGGSVKTMRRM